MNWLTGGELAVIHDRVLEETGRVRGTLRTLIARGEITVDQFLAALEK